MKKLLVFGALLALLPAGLHARPVPAQGGTENLIVSWRPYVGIPNGFGQPPTGLQCSDCSVSIDSEGASHFAQLVYNGPNNRYEIWYFNTRYEARYLNGFSNPVLIEAGTIIEEVGRPDIWVDANDGIHIVWGRWDAAGDFSGLRYLMIPPFGPWPAIRWITLPVIDVIWENPQICVTDTGIVHVLAHKFKTLGTPFNLGVDLTVPPNTGFGVEYPVIGANPGAFLRFAIRGNDMWVTWDDNNNWKLTHANISNGTPQWDTQVWGSTTNSDKLPDVAIDRNGIPHLTWVKTTSTNPLITAIYHQMGTSGSPNVVSGPPIPTLNFSGTRILIWGDNVHVFYDGYSHATRPLDDPNWSYEQPLKSPTGSKHLTARPEEVAGYRGRFDLVNKDYYVRTFENMQDGASWETTMPGGSVNLVPLNGSFQYRLNLFSTKGVGPCASLGMTYNSREMGASLLGPGWTMDHLMSITVPGDGEDIALTLPNGLTINFNWDANLGYALSDRSFGFVAKLQLVASTWTLTADGGTEYAFTQGGKLGSVKEATGNHLDVVYNQTTGMPTQIVDMLGNGGLGRITTLEYGTSGPDSRRVTKVTDPLLSQYILKYSQTTRGYQLTSVAFVGLHDDGVTEDGPLHSFGYGTNGSLSTITTPRGNSYTVNYDDAGRVIEVVDPQASYVQEGSETVVQTPLLSWKVFYNDTMYQNVIGAGKFHTRVEDRRHKQSISVFDPSNRYGVSEYWDQSALNQVAGVYSVRRTFDALGFGNTTALQDRWNNTTSYEYFSPPASAPWLTNQVKKVKKPNSVGTAETVEEFTYTNDKFGNVLTHTTYSGGVGRVTTNYHDSVTGQLTSILYPDVLLPDGVTWQSGVSKSFLYLGPRKQLSRSVNEMGNATYTLTSDFHPINGLPLKVFRDGGSQPEETTYDAIGNVTGAKHPQGNGSNDPTAFTVFGLDELHRIHTITDPLSKVTTNTYDQDSNVTTVQPPVGAASTTTYDPRSFVSGGATPDGLWTQMVDANGNVRQKTNSRLATTRTKYDDLDRVSEAVVPGAGTAGGGGPDMTTQWSYDGIGVANQRFTLETRVGINPHPSRVTKTLYDPRHRVIRVLASDTKTATDTVYNELDQVVATQTIYDPDGLNQFKTATVTFRDKRDRVERVRIQNAPNGSSPSQFSDTVSFYNKAGAVFQVVDPLGDATIGGYAHKRTYALDARDRIIQVFDGKGIQVTENIWGDDDLLSDVKVLDPSTKSNPTLVFAEHRTYTARKELKSTKNVNGNGLTYVYGVIQGQVSTVTDAQGRITETLYDVNTQRPLQVNIAKGTTNERRTQSVWLNGLLSQTKVFNPATSTDFGSVYIYTYDKSDRLEKLEYPSAIIAPESHTYTEFGQEYQFTAGAKTITHQYDDLGLNTFRTWSGGIYSAVESRTYFPMGLPNTVTCGSYQKRFDYDFWHATLKSETFKVGAADWKIQTHFFDKAKNYQFMTDTEAAIHEWVYDENNRVKQIKYGIPGICDIFYTPGGLVDMTQLRDASGAVISQTTLTYDLQGRKTRQQTVQFATGQILADFQWEYDSLDLITATVVNHLGVRADFLYNEVRELKQEAWSGNGSGGTPPAYTNQIGGPAGPKVSPPSNVAQANPHTVGAVTAVTKVYDYFKDGSRKTLTVAGVTTTYAYNAASQLITESAPGLTSSHTYDQWGNEYQRVTTPPGGSGGTETYLYNYLNLLSDYTKGGTVHWQYDFWPTGERYSKANLNNSAQNEYYISRSGDVVTEYSSPTTLKNTYVQGTGIDSKYTRIGGGTRRHFIGDSVGTVSVTLTDVGAAAETTLKDAWGVAFTGSGLSTTERYGFAQRETDAESSLVHMRARQYDPKIGRFIQTDPIVAGRPFEHYAYASNNPICKVDLMGTWPGWTEGMGRAARRAGFEAEQAALSKRWYSSEPEDLAYVRQSLVDSRPQEKMLEGIDLHIARKCTVDVTAKIQHGVNIALEFAGGAAIVAGSGGLALAGGVYIMVDSASEGSGWLNGSSEADPVGTLYEGAFGEEAGPWVRGGVRLAVGLSASLSTPRSAVGRNSPGTWEGFVRKSQELPGNAPAYTAADEAANARWVIASEGRGFTIREFEYTDLMRRTKLDKHIADVRARGLENPTINYTVVDDTPYVLFGNNRLHAARVVPGMTRTLNFQEVGLPFRGYKTIEDVLNSAAEIAARLSGGR